ncbi:hypothetical protein [Flaviaesturariibacter flavus]|nr:hypothetical protein [Flaviaesturariibacter flavus]
MKNMLIAAGLVGAAIAGLLLMTQGNRLAASRNNKLVTARGSHAMG